VILAVGRSSLTVAQGLFVGDACAATAETVIVMTDVATRRSTPLPEDLRARLTDLSLPA
jgi:acyl-CoA thioester hydrolase